MPTQPEDKSDQPAQSSQPGASVEDLPDRLCTWCKVPMLKRPVGGGLYIHYTCPKCIFQHTSKRQPPQTS